jgi:phosphoglycerate kinase
MRYSDVIRPHRLVNLSLIKSPALLNIDINLPMANGKIAEDAKRMEVYSDLIEIYSEYTGLVLMAHQGRKGDDDFTSFMPHYRLFLKMLPSDIELEFIPYDRIFRDGGLQQDTIDKIKRLGPRQAILLDNLRYFDFEDKFDAGTCPYVALRGVVGTCINDAISAWHRNNSRLMCMPYVAKTYVGMRSSYELRVLEDDIMASRASKALISGGKKLQKASDMGAIYNSGVAGFTGGLIGQLVARVNGYDLGEKNNLFLENSFASSELEDAKVIAKLGARYPVDFTVLENGVARNDVPLNEMKKTEGVIMDIGSGTVEKYAEELQSYEIRIRAGPLGVIEQKYLNGIELTKRIAGDGLIFLGGDTSQEVIMSGLDRQIVNGGGQILISGGSALHRLADGRYACLDLMMKMSQ